MDSAHKLFLETAMTGVQHARGGSTAAYNGDVGVAKNNIVASVASGSLRAVNGKDVTHTPTLTEAAENSADSDDAGG